MIFSKSSMIALAAAGLHAAMAIQLDVNNPTSVKAASRALAYGVQAWYHSNVTGDPETAIGTFPSPTYWWEGGAIWGGMVDYWAYTNDPSWNEVITQGLLAQIGPDSNFMPPAYFSSLGNDDQAFWALTALSAVEYGFPIPEGQSETLWFDLAKAVFDSQTPRWETTTCGGGLRWQIFEANKGWTYKNTISNGGLFQMAARLARYTGNQTYVDWAEKTWDWMSAIGLISPSYEIFDGTDMTINCTQINRLQWSYNPAMLIYGTAMLADFTGDQVWKDRTESLLSGVETRFISPYENATNIMYEPECEPYGTCNYDQLSFKAYLARWLAKAAVVYPPITSTVLKWMQASSLAAAKSCTGGDDGKTCGQKWYVGGYDGAFGVGQELSAMETVQALLLLTGNAARVMPLQQKGVTSTSSSTPSSTSSPSSSTLSSTLSPTPKPATPKPTTTTRSTSFVTSTSASSSSSSSSPAPPPLPPPSTTSVSSTTTADPKTPQPPTTSVGSTTTSSMRRLTAIPVVESPVPTTSSTTSSAAPSSTTSAGNRTAVSTLSIAATAVVCGLTFGGGLGIL